MHWSKTVLFILPAGRTITRPGQNRGNRRLTRQIRPTHLGTAEIGVGHIFERKSPYERL